MSTTTTTTTSFTKSETLRRLRKAGQLAKASRGLASNSPVELGVRTVSSYLTSADVDRLWEQLRAGVTYADTEADLYGVEEDGQEADLSYNTDLKDGSTEPEVQKVGYVAHIYVSAYNHAWREWELYTTCVVWLGDHDHDPVLIDADGSPVIPT